MSKLNFAVCGLFVAILFAFTLCFALVFAKLDRMESNAAIARHDVVTLYSEVKTLQSTIDTLQVQIADADESLESVEYFVYDNGTIQIVRDNGETVTYCLQNADCDN